MKCIIDDGKTYTLYGEYESDEIFISEINPESEVLSVILFNKRLVFKTFPDKLKKINIYLSSSVLTLPEYLPDSIEKIYVGKLSKWPDRWPQHLKELELDIHAMQSIPMIPDSVVDFSDFDDEDDSYMNYPGENIFPGYKPIREAIDKYNSDHDNYVNNGCDEPEWPSFNYVEPVRIFNRMKRTYFHRKVVNRWRRYTRRNRALREIYYEYTGHSLPVHILKRFIEI